MKVISTANAPKALGPYSQAIDSGNLVFLSGQIPLDPTTNELKNDHIAMATEQVFDNISAVLQATDLTLQNVVKVMVFMKDLGQFEAMNVVYEQRFQGHKPARSTVEVAKLPKDVLIEIEVIAQKP